VTREFGVEMVNGPDAPAWFLVKLTGAVWRVPLEPRIVLHSVNLRPRDLGAEVRAVELCDGSVCDLAVHLPPGASVFFRRTTEARPWEGKFGAEVWRLASLDFEGEPAERWISRELVGGDGLSSQDRPYVLLGQVDLAVDQRWEFTLDMTKSAEDRSH
jgi:hypothetical protein